MHTSKSSVKIKLPDRDVTSPKQAALMAVVALMAVTAVGVSTAQVITTLAEDGARQPYAATSMSALDQHDLSITLVRVPNGGESTLILKNVTDKNLDFRHLHTASIAVDGVRINCSKINCSHSITLEPDRNVSLKISDQDLSVTRNDMRVVTMNGRVIDGNIVLYAN